MVARSARRRSAGLRSAGHQAAGSTVMSGLARAGLAARGVIYGLIGIIAVEIALGTSHQQADRSGAVRLVASTPFGKVILWLLVVGFAGLTLWRLSEAIWGPSGADGHKTSARLTSLAKAVIYGFVTYGILKYALGLGAPASTNRQSRDLTATALKYPGGQVAVAIVGLIIAGIGLKLAYEAYKRKFLRDMRMARRRQRHASSSPGSARPAASPAASSSSPSGSSCSSRPSRQSLARQRASTPRSGRSRTRRLGRGCLAWSLLA